MATNQKKQIDVDRYLLHGPMPEISKMNKAELLDECQMWRNVWSWIPSEVKYYAARVGQQVGIIQINFRRHLGILLGTHWDLIEMELGVMDKEYDVNTGKYYFEQKIVKMKTIGIRIIEWIKSREEIDEKTGDIAAPPPETQPQTESSPEESSPEENLR